MRITRSRLAFVGIALVVLGMAVIAAGLVGTVGGMIRAFQTVARRDTSPSARQLAQSIRSSLTWTIAGLAAGGVLSVVGGAVIAAAALKRPGRFRDAPPPGADPCGPWPPGSALEAPSPGAASPGAEPAGSPGDTAPPRGGG